MPSQGGVSAFIEGGHTHRRKLEKWLSKPFSDTARLVGHVVGEVALPLGEWPRDQIASSLADDILNLCDGHFLGDDGMPLAAEMTFSLQMLAADGRSLSVHTINYRRRAVSAEDPASRIPMALDGSEKASSALAQSVALSMARMFMAGQAAQTNAMVTVIESLTARLRDAEDEVSARREQADELRELVMAMKDADGGQPMSDAQRKFFELAERMATALLLGAGKPD